MTDESQAKLTRAQLHVQWADRRAEALDYRRTGLSYEGIGEKMGITKQGAWELVKAALEIAIREPGDAVRELERQRLDAALLAIHKRIDALNPDSDSVDKAVDVMLRLMTRRAKLDGLDVETAAPVVAITAAPEAFDTSRFTPEELRAWFLLQAKGTRDDASRARYEAAAQALGPTTEVVA